MKAIIVACLLCPEQCDAIVAKLVWMGYTVLPWVSKKDGTGHTPIAEGATDLVSKMMDIKIEHNKRSFEDAKLEIKGVINEYKHFGHFIVDLSDGGINKTTIGNGTIKSDKALRQEHAEKYT